MQMDGDVPAIKVQIAHIRAANKNGPRFDANMTDDERRAFPNLLLLCTYHHASVDGKRPRCAASAVFVQSSRHHRRSPASGSPRR